MELFGNRFDDSEGYFRVLYAASSPLGCFVETLARYRKPPDLKALAEALDRVENAPNERIPFGTVPISRLHNRILGQAVSKRARFADMYCAEWLSYLRRHFEPGLMARRLDATHYFDLALLASQDRRLTQQIATIVYQLGYDGIHYQSRHGSNLDNWALFEPFGLDLAPSTLIAPDDSNLHSALRLLNLSLDHSL
ncbi:MAG TPA: RES family NAD+ phosphorylase [Bryobacteraceae bacterium]|jgi:hypothetical protein|nr:RES family NAD+ phosphorylase [Bryobacteraceae bacterium]